MADAAAVEYDGSSGKRQHEVEMVLDDQDRDVAAQTLDRSEQFVNQRWRETLERRVEGHGALGRRYQAHDGLDRRRLAGAVAAKQGEHLMASYLERHIVQDMALAVERVDCFDVEQRCRRSNRWPPRALRRGSCFGAD